MAKRAYEPGEVLPPGALRLALAAIGPLMCVGCLENLADYGCRKLSPVSLRVDAERTCTFNYEAGDVARYRVVVMRPPVHGEAAGDGKYLIYAAKPGFVGEDNLTIRLERRSIRHVRWQTLNVTVRVGPAV